MSGLIRVHPLLRIPPPLLFVVTFLAGVGLQYVLPLSIHGPGLASASLIFGRGLVISGILLALCCVGMFLIRRTTLIPFGNANRLVTNGPYRFSRNPMYVSLVMVYIGLAVILAQIWPAILLPLPILIMQTVVIPFEEMRMHTLFGSDFAEYCARVRRWL